MCIRDRFYSAQVSSGITFAQTNSGPRAYGVIRDFYLAPMEQADISGITFFSFEAQREGPVSYTHLDVYKRQWMWNLRARCASAFREFG